MHPGLGLAVGGRSSDEAAEKLIGAFSFLIDTLLQRGGLKAVEGRLERGGGATFTWISQTRTSREPSPYGLHSAKC